MFKKSFSYLSATLFLACSLIISMSSPAMSVPILTVTNSVINFQWSSGDSAPVGGKVAPSTLIGWYSGSVNTSQWSPFSIAWRPVLNSGRVFASGTTYTVNVTINSRSNLGWNFDGLDSNFFTSPGATSVSTAYSVDPSCTTSPCTATRAIVTIEFPATASLSAPVQTPEQIAAAEAEAAKAAAEEAAKVRAAAIASAQSELFQILRLDNAGTIEQYRSANIPVTTTSSLDRLNSAVLALPVNDRNNFSRIREIADQIEFDEAFFNATSRPTIATYNRYGVFVTERTLENINSKVLNLPRDKRLDISGISEIAKSENFIDRVANPATRIYLSSKSYIANGYLDENSPNKYSVVKGLLGYSEESLNTQVKLEAAIKELIEEAQAPRFRTLEIRKIIESRR